MIVNHSGSIKVFGEKTSNIDEIKRGLEENVPSAPDNNLGVPLTSDEVAKKLRFASNSSPGADKVDYRHLKKIDCYL